MRILIDMDGVIADFEQGLVDEFQKLYPDMPFVPVEERRTFYAKEQYPPELRDKVENIMNSQYFYRNFKPIQGGIEALQELASSNHEVFICSAPKTGNLFCVQEKIEWLAEYLGTAWLKKTVITKDKTIVMGDILIDDKPTVSGIQKPTWEHVIYSQPYNLDVKDKRRLTWDNWKSVLL